MASSPIALIFLLFAIVFLIGGIVLLKRGRWPARVGDEPHCRACEYLLIGIESQRCPECGAALSARNIVHGMRERRAGLVATGAGLILLAILCLLPTGIAGWNAIDWIRIEPTSWLVRDVKSSFAWPAWQELKRRDGNGSLSDAQIQAIIDIALQQQAATTRSPIADELVSFAGDQLLAGKMTVAQKQKFGEQSLLLSLSVRSKVALGKFVPYLLEERSGTPSAPWWVTESIRIVKLDGKIIEDNSKDPGGHNAQSGLGAGGSMGSSVMCSTLGKHELTLVVRMILYRGTFNVPNASTVIYQEDRELAAKFEMVAPAEALVHLTADPKLEPQIRAAIKPDGFVYYAATRRLSGQVIFSAPPCDLAFDVVGRWNGREHVLCGISCNTGKSVSYSVGGPIDDSLPGFINIILRSSEKVAANTTNLADIWKGELIYPNVPVKMQAK